MATSSVSRLLIARKITFTIIIVHLLITLIILVHMNYFGSLL
jgi:hypothetical protein